MAVKRRNFSWLLTPDLKQVYMKQGEWGTAAAPWALIGPVRCTHTTERAIQVKWEGATIWIPRSMLHKTENEVSKIGDEGMLIIPEWLAKLKGWL